MKHQQQEQQLLTVQAQVKNLPAMVQQEQAQLLKVQQELEVLLVDNACS